MTTVDDAGLNRDILELIDSLHRVEALKIRVYGMISNSPENLDYYLDKGISQTDRLTIRSVKVYADGALGSRGAALKSPYTDDPKNNGLFLTTKEEIENLAFFVGKKRLSNEYPCHWRCSESSSFGRLYQGLSSESRPR